jgi:hypothetical protein
MRRVLERGIPDAGGSILNIKDWNPGSKGLYIDDVVRLPAVEPIGSPFTRGHHLNLETTRAPRLGLELERDCPIGLEIDAMRLILFQDVAIGAGEVE